MGNNSYARWIVEEVKCAVAGNMVITGRYVLDWLSRHRLPIELLSPAAELDSEDGFGDY